MSHFKDRFRNRFNSIVTAFNDEMNNLFNDMESDSTQMVINEVMDKVNRRCDDENDGIAPMPSEHVSPNDTACHDTSELKRHILLYKSKLNKYETQLSTLKNQNKRLKNDVTKFKDDARQSNRQILLLFCLLNDKSETNEPKDEDSETDISAHSTDDGSEQFGSGKGNSAQRSLRFARSVNYRETQSPEMREKSRSPSLELIVNRDAETEENHIVDLSSDDEPTLNDITNKCDDPKDAAEHTKIKTEPRIETSPHSTSSWYSAKSSPRHKISSTQIPPKAAFGNYARRAIRRGRGRRGGLSRGVSRRRGSARKSMNTLFNVSTHDSDDDQSKSAKKSKKEYKCTFEECEYTCDDEFGIKFHVEGHRNAKYKCPYCYYTGMMFQGIKRHMAERHKDRKVYECEYCKKRGKTFGDDIEYVFRDHMCKHIEKAKSKKGEDFDEKDIEKIIDEFLEDMFKNKAAVDCHH